jgi:hypothetical protein
MDLDDGADDAANGADKPTESSEKKFRGKENRDQLEGSGHRNEN